MHRRSVKDSLSDVGGAVAWADRIATQAGAPERVRQDLQVCLEEALANLIMHGEAVGRKAITLELSASDRGVDVVISDRCAPFDAADAPLRTMSDERPGGAGLRLLRAFASELRYTSEAGRNVLTLKLGNEANPALLRQIAAFGNASEATLLQMAQRSEVLKFEVGANLMAQGDVSEFAIILLYGRVTIVSERTHGSFPVATIHAPALIGEIGALADLPRTASAVTASKVVALRVPRSVLWDVLQSAPDALAAVVGQLGGQIKAVNAALGLYAEGFRALERGELDDELAHDLANTTLELQNFSEAFARLANRIQQERRTRADMASAAVIQREMLPRDFSGAAFLSRCDVFADMTPAKDVGGDFYDIVSLDDDHVALCVGDVCGKGVPASLFMCMTVATLRLAVRDRVPLDDMMEKVNTLLFEQNPTSMFATVVFGVLDLRDGLFRYLNCGHNQPFLLRAEGGVERLASGAPPVGIAPKKRWPVNELRLSRGDAVFLFSDGVSEAFDAQDAEYGDDRLMNVLANAPSRDAQALVRAVTDDVARFAEGAEQADDITCLAFVLR